MGAKIKKDKIKMDQKCPDLVIDFLSNGSRYQLIPQ